MSEITATVSMEHLALTPQMALDRVEDDEDRERVEEYIDSGDDLWRRDADLLDGLPKIELEALDPVELRDLVIEAIRRRIDTTVLKRITAEQKDERDRIKSAFTGLADGLDGETA